MGVDPVSMFVAALVVAALVKRVPGLVAQFAEQASQGESDEDRQRAERLKEAGLEPATGGPVRRFFTNLWRDAWLDLDDARQARREAGRDDHDRDGESGSGRSWWDRVRDWWSDRRDEAARRRTDRWRTDADDGDDRWNHPDDPLDDPLDDPADANPDDDTPHGRGREDGPRGADDDDDSPHDRRDQPEPEPELEPEPWSTGGQDPHAEPWPFPDHGEEGARRREWRAAADNFPHTATDGAAQQARGPVVGTLERNDPQPAPPAAIGGTGPTVIEGEVVTEVARGGAVTGVVSGAAEARAIQRAMDETNAAYIAALERLRRRIIALGEQTLSEVQMSARSDVVQHTAQAAEAAASAQAHARGVGAEVGPLLGMVARAFNRRNS